MMKIIAGLALVSVIVLGSEHDSHELGWLVGCWVSPDGSAQEVWVVDSDQSLLGFGVAFREGSRLVATTSLLGGGNPNVFDKTACGQKKARA